MLNQKLDINTNDNSGNCISEDKLSAQASNELTEKRNILKLKKDFELNLFLDNDINMIFHKNYFSLFKREKNLSSEMFCEAHNLCTSCFSHLSVDNLKIKMKSKKLKSKILRKLYICKFCKFERIMKHDSRNILKKKIDLQNNLNGESDILVKPTNNYSVQTKQEHQVQWNLKALNKSLKKSSMQRLSLEDILNA